MHHAVSGLARRRSTLRWAAEVGFIAIAVTSLTLGPVYTFRLRWPTIIDLAKDPAVVTWMMVIHIVAAVLVASRWDRIRGCLRPVPAAAVLTLCALLVASTAWSEAPARTIEVGLGVAATVITGIYLMSATEPRARLAGVTVGLHIGVLWSAWRIAQETVGSLDADGRWTGVYFNRNSLAPVAALGALCACWLALATLRGSLRWSAKLGVTAVAAALVLVDARLLIGAGSRTAAIAAGAGAVASAALLALPHLIAPPLRALRWWRAAGIAGAGVIAALALTRAVGGPQWGGDLTGRTAVWGVVVEWWWKRPIQGWGYLSLWGTNVEFTLDQYARNDNVAASSAHNALLDILLGAGLVAALAFVVLIAAGWDAAGRMAVRRDQREAVWLAAGAGMWVFCLVLNLAETFVIAHSLYWALLAGGSLAAWTARPTTDLGENPASEEESRRIVARNPPQNRLAPGGATGGWPGSGR